MNNKIYWIFILLCLLNINLVLSFQESLGIFKQDTCISLTQTCDNCTAVNITSIIDPNSVKLYTDLQMTKQGTDYNYTFCNTSSTGIYIYNTLGNPNGVMVVQPVNFEITFNGYEKPTGIVVVMFSIFFLILLLSLTYIIIYSLGHAVTLDFDIIDASYNYGLFFVLVGLLLLEKVYLGNSQIESFLNLSIDIGIWTNLVLPTFYFFLTLTMGTILKRRQQGVGVYK